MKKSTLFLSIVLASSITFGQTTEAEENLKQVVSTDTIRGWKTGGNIGLNFSQVSLTNWAAGGQNSYSLNGLLSLFANKKGEKYAWDNSLDLAYGLLQQGESGVQKTDDRIEFLSKYGQKATKNWYYAALLNFRSQMTDGYNYPNDSVAISRFLAPGYLLGAIGMDYKPNDNFTVFISPLTLKMTIVNDQNFANAGAYGVDAAVYDPITGNLTTLGKKTRTEFGGYLRGMYKKDIMKNVNFLTRLDLFSNYANNPQNIDVNWEVLIAMKINKYITATLNTLLIYDHDIDIAVDRDGDSIKEGVGPRTQFREVFGVGFSYKL